MQNKSIKVTAGNYSRREFLSHVAVLGGAAVAAPLLSSSGLAKSAQQVAAPSSGKVLQARRLGVLLPDSASYPGVANSYLAGLNLYLEQAGRHEISVSGATISATASGVLDKAEALLQQEKVDLLLGVLNPGVASFLGEALATAKTALIASGLGENVPRLAETSPNIFYHTMNLWHANWALGAWAAQNLGKKALLAASFFDSGYDMLYAFRLGFESQGGTALATEVTHQPSGAASFAQLLTSVKQARPDFVFASYHGQLASEFLSSYASAGFAGSLPLVGTSFLAATGPACAPTAAARGVNTVTSWNPSSDSPANQLFVTAFKNKTGLAPDALALLGYEAGHLAVGALDKAALSGQPEHARNALATASFDGPRGAIAMNGKTQMTTAPLYLQQVCGRGPALNNMVLSQLAATTIQDMQLAIVRASAKSGWLNSYLCG